MKVVTTPILTQNKENCLKVESPFIYKKHFQMSDIAEILNGGEFLLKGRIDRICKIEEKRISLDEIEIILKKNKKIQNAHCVIDDSGPRKIICCIIILHNQSDYQKRP